MCASEVLDLLGVEPRHRQGRGPGGVGRRLHLSSVGSGPDPHRAGGGAGDRGNDISIRGMPSQYTLILVDGRPQNSGDGAEW